MSESHKPHREIVFAPGCFDSFEGTQEELTGLIAAIHRMNESGELYEGARQVGPEEDAIVESMIQRATRQ